MNVADNFRKNKGFRTSINPECLLGENRFKAYKGYPLSERELEVIKLFASLHTLRQIAAQLGIAIHTVDNHRKNAYYKLGLHCHGELIHYALAKGLVPNRFTSDLTK